MDKLYRVVLGILLPRVVLGILLPRVVLGISLPRVVLGILLPRVVLDILPHVVLGNPSRYWCITYIQQPYNSFRSSAVNTRTLFPLLTLAILVTSTPMAAYSMELYE